MKRITLSILFSLFLSGLYAQQDLLMYNMQNIPQSSYSNPSNRFAGKFYIGLPAMSSNYFRLSNTIKYSDAIKKQNGELLLSFNSMLKEMKDNNYLSFSTRIDLMSFGFNVSPSTQIIVNVTENVNFTLGYNKDLVEFIYKGNAGFSGSSPNFNGSGINAMHYREYGVGASHQLNDKLRLGVRLKYLYGMENIYTENFDIGLTTNPETYALTAQSNFKVRTSGFDNVDSDESFSKYFSGRANQGFGVDLGGFYQLNEKWSFNASVVDLGFIKWNDYTKTYEGNGSFTYDGIEINNFVPGNEPRDPNDPAADGNTSFDRVLDSLENQLGIKESTGAYTSPLVTKIYLGANYHINERSFAGAIIQNEIFEGQLRPSFSLNYGRKMTDWITLTGAYSAINGAYDNLGIGFSIDPGPVQFYVMSDNLLGVFQPQHTRNLHVRFGINLIFGREKTKKIFNKGSKKVASEGTNPIESDSTSASPETTIESDSSKTGEMPAESDSLNTEEGNIQSTDENSDELELVEPSDEETLNPETENTEDTIPQDKQTEDGNSDSSSDDETSDPPKDVNSNSDSSEERRR